MKVYLVIRSGGDYQDAEYEVVDLYSKLCAAEDHVRNLSIKWPHSYVDERELLEGDTAVITNGS